MTVEIKGEQRALAGVFSEAFEYQVPPYQRPYLWEIEHAGALLDDLLDYMGDSAKPITELDPYFLGSIVLIKSEARNAQIVDGQQRLITLTILLSALRSVLPSKYTSSITKRIYEPEDPAAGLPARYLLHPRDQDTAFFMRYIQREDGLNELNTVNLAVVTDSQRHMGENARYFLGRLRESAEEIRARLLEFIVQRCILVVVSTPDLNSAYRIFSVLNDRGLDLSYTDILKAEIIGKIPADQQQAYTEKWEQTEEDLGRADFEALLSHIRTIVRAQRLKKTILEEFREFIVQPMNDSARLIDTVLVPYADAYATISDQDYEHAGGVGQTNAYLRWLDRIPDKDWMPSAMEYLSVHRAEPQEVEAFLKDLERLAAGLMLRRTNVNRRMERYRDVLAAIKHGDDLRRADSPLQLTAEERRAALDTITGPIYRQAVRLRQYVLLRLDNHLSGGDAQYTFPTVSIEHVLPQNPARGSDWLTWFPTPELRNHWTDRLGNLALLSRRKNARASNYTFEKKKSIYFTTAGGVAPFALTTQVLREHEWTPAVVQKRQNELAAALRELWRL